MGTLPTPLFPVIHSVIYVVRSITVLLFASVTLEQSIFQTCLISPFTHKVRGFRGENLAQIGE